MSTDFLSAAFALLAAGVWGAGDFTGGLSARRSDALRSVLGAYTVGLVLVTIVALALREQLPPAADLIWGAVAGLSGMVGIGFLFRGFQTGRMGIVAPVSAVLTAGIPVLFSAVVRQVAPPTYIQMAGFVVALVGIWLLARPERITGRPQGLGMAVIAGLGFAGFFIGLDQVGPAAKFWPLVSGRLASWLVMVVFMLVTRRPFQVRQLPIGLLAMSGTLDIAGNLFFLLATQAGRLDVASVLASLYPAVTALLARVVVKEHLTRPQLIGVVLAVLAIVMITLKDPCVVFPSIPCGQF